MVLHRILLGILLVLGIIGCIFNQLLDMTFIVGMSHPELGAETITDERRLELVSGLLRGNAVQRRVNYLAWWTTLAVTVIAILSLFQTFRTANMWRRSR